MQHPRNDSEIDYATPLECDVVIAGAELAGLVAGAVLAKRGVRVIVVDEPPVVGGRGGAIEHRGYWIDGGHRAGRDVTDLMFPWQHGARAAREAGVEVHVKAIRSGLRIHLVPEPGSGAPGRVMDAADWTPDGFAKLATDAFACPAEALPDFLEALQRVSTSSAAEQRAAISVTLEDWLAQNVKNPAAHAPLYNMVKSMFSDHPRLVSAGRVMKLMDFQVASAEGDLQFTGLADDPEVGGTQGIIEPFARGIEANGGRVILDHRPVAVSFEGPRATGLVATSPAHLVLRVRARHSIVAYPIWSALPLLPPERVDDELRTMSRVLEDYGTTGVGWVAGLTRLPRLRASGAVEDYPGWNRLLVGPERHFSGGYHFPTLATRRAAPADRHLLSSCILSWVRRGEHPDWPRLDAKLQHAKAYLHDLYADLDACIEWQADRFVDTPPAFAAGWYWAPTLRHEIRLPGFENLFVASSTIEGDLGTVDGAAFAGLESARAILAERPAAGG